MAVDDLHLESMHNFRDIAGRGYETTDGPMRRGRFFRANIVAPSDRDADALRRIGLRTIVDLRRPEEVEKNPDHDVIGADYVHVDVLGESSSAATIVGYDEDATPETARSEMLRVYRSFVVDAGFRERLRPAFEAVAASSGPVVVHCTVGKDRTGFVSAVLQLLAGAGREDILADYLETNRRSEAWVAELSAMFREHAPERADTLIELLHARDEYITTSLDAIEAEYGSARDYLVDGVGLGAAEVERLRATLLGREGD